MKINKILYTFYDVFGNVSTLTLDKYVAESIVKKHGDVHRWIQKQYDEIVLKRIEVTRRSVGDLIRARAQEIFWSDPDTFADL